MVDTMKKTFLLIAAALSSALSLCAQTQPTRAELIAAEIKNPQSKKVLVVAHRGDWREWPENSLEAFQSAINKGADIIELDLKKTKDGVLVVCHDAKLDRTTTGKGFVKDFTADSISNLYLKADTELRQESVCRLCVRPLNSAKIRPL